MCCFIICIHNHTHTRTHTHTEKNNTMSEEKFIETRTRHKIFMNYFCLYYISRCNLHVSATSFYTVTPFNNNQLNHVNVEMYSFLRWQRWCGNDDKCMYRTGITNSHTHLHIQTPLQPSPLPSFPVPKNSVWESSAPCKHHLKDPTITLRTRFPFSWM